MSNIDRSAYDLPDEKTTLVVMLNTGASIPGLCQLMQDITRLISPDHVWTGLPSAGTP